MRLDRHWRSGCAGCEKSIFAKNRLHRLAEICVRPGSSRASFAHCTTWNPSTQRVQFGSQFVQELHERLLAIPFANLNHLAGLVVDYDGDVDMTLAN